MYFRNLLKLSSLWRFVTFRSDYATIWHSMKRLVVKPAAKPVVAAAAELPPEQRGNANPLFPPAYFEFLKRGGKALMVFSEKDRLWSEYEEKFEAPFAEALKPLAGNIEKHVIANANHVMALQRVAARDGADHARLDHAHLGGNVNGSPCSVSTTSAWRCASSRPRSRCSTARSATSRARRPSRTRARRSSYSS